VMLGHVLPPLGMRYPSLRRHSRTRSMAASMRRPGRNPNLTKISFDGAPSALAAPTPPQPPEGTRCTRRGSHRSGALNVDRLPKIQSRDPNNACLVTGGLGRRERHGDVAIAEAQGTGRPAARPPLSRKGTACGRLGAPDRVETPRWPASRKGSYRSAAGALRPALALLADRRRPRPAARRRVRDQPLLHPPVL
jgi:hypothetical protein